MRVITEDVVARYREKEFAIFTLGISEKFNDRHQKWKKIIDAPLSSDSKNTTLLDAWQELSQEC